MNTTRKIFTVRDSRMEKYEIEAIADYSDFGQLCRNGRTVFYVYEGGYAERNYVEGNSRWELAAKLHKMRGAAR